VSSLAEMLDIFDVKPGGDASYIGDSDPGTRDVIDGSQLLAGSSGPLRTRGVSSHRCGAGTDHV
jgi:hypothetical protein